MAQNLYLTVAMPENKEVIVSSFFFSGKITVSYLSNNMPYFISNNRREMRERELTKADMLLDMLKKLIVNSQ